MRICISYAARSNVVPKQLYPLSLCQLSNYYEHIFTNENIENICERTVEETSRELLWR